LVGVSPQRSAGTALLERERELSTLGEALDAAGDGEGRLVVVRGPAGIGKTSLVAASRRLAHDREMLVLGARGETIDRDYGFGVARQLLEEPARARLAAGRLNGAAALTESALGLGDGEDAASIADPFAPRHGLYWLAADLAEERPVLLAVDDAQWADSPSLQWLAFLGRRVDGLALALIVAVREEEEVDPSLAALEGEPVAEIILPRPLSREAVASMIAAEGAEPGLAAAVHRATDGNPLWVNELLRALSVDGPAVLGELEGAPEMTPGSVTRAVLARLGQLPEGSIELARAVAVLGSEVEAADATAVAGLERGSADRAARALVDAGVLVDEQGGLSFGHPIVREAVYADLGSAGRGARHTAAARVLAGRGSDPEQIAAHLLLVPPGSGRWVIDGLRAAADSALARGAPEAAATYLKRALSEDTGEDRVEILHRLGSAEVQLYDPSAPEHLLDAYRAAPPGERAAIALDAALALYMLQLRLDEGIALLEETLAETPAADREARLQLTAMLFIDHHQRGDALEFPEALPAGGTPGERAVLASLSLARLLQTMDAEEALRTARAAWADGRLLAEAGPDSGHMWSPIVAAIYGAIQDDAYADAVAWCDQFRDAARRGGSATAYVMALALRSWAQFRRGEVGEALADAREVLEGFKGDTLAVPFASGQGEAPPHPFLLYPISESLIEGGELAAFDAALQAWGLDGPLARSPSAAPLLERRGKLRIAQGELESGVEDLLEAGGRLEWNPEGWGSWRAHAAIALSALGRRDEARALVAVGLELAQRMGLPRAIAIAERAAALIEQPPHHQGLKRSAETAASAGARLEQARALTDLGAAVRRAGQRRRAREVLHDALDLAMRCGAPVLAQRAREELRAAGGRLRRSALSGPESLTPSEARVARMAAAGRSNREIAQALFLTVRTIEMHLTNAYAKLEIASRSELPKALGQTDDRSEMPLDA
jgi:DNA-binding CsgD family transcriptional regulator